MYRFPCNSIPFYYGYLVAGNTLPKWLKPASINCNKNWFNKALNSYGIVFVC
jgi:hypothetical protein